MAGEYEKAITINEARKQIEARKLLLPAIQRNFVWNTDQICTLFDSLMRGYPINTFMMWDVKCPKIKEEFRFYEFLDSYCQRFKEDNPFFPTRGHDDFKAVIDGQQRLTSIYIGLKGTYAYKQPRVWWPDVQNDSVLPPRKLYLDLVKPIEDEDSLMQYNFRFLTNAQYKASLEKDGIHWYEVGTILNTPDVNGIDKVPFGIVLPYLKEHGLEDNQFAMETLTRLFVAIRMEKLIHFFNETSQEIDHVLDVFIRTNSGGTTLAFSDLLMSIAIANWRGDARKDIDDLATQIWRSSDMGFSINRDWILKTSLMLVDADVRFRVKNFNATQVEVIERQWTEISTCVAESFKLLRSLGLNDQSLRAKNAVIPIAYYLFKKTFRGEPLFRTINNLAYNRDERIEIGRWLHMALLKGVFGGQSDGMLTKMRNIINNHLEGTCFPLPQIIDAYKGTNKDLRFDDEYVSNLLNIQYGDSRCRSVLALLFPEVNENQVLHIDHLHPKSAFEKKALSGHEFLKSNEELMRFFADPCHWNSMANLHLLNSSQNTSKNASPLVDWLENEGNGFRVEDLLIDSSVSLGFDQFKTFYEKRREALKQRLCGKLYLSEQAFSSMESNTDDEDGDEE